MVGSIQNAIYYPDNNPMRPQNFGPQDPSLSSIFNMGNLAMQTLSRPMMPLSMGMPNMGGMMGMMGIFDMNPAMGMNQSVSANNRNMYSYMGDPNVRMIAENLRDELDDVCVDESRVQKMLKTLAKENPEKLAALELTYGQMYGEPDQLRKDIRNSKGIYGMGKPHSKEFDYLNEAAVKSNSPQNIALGLREAMQGAGTDSRTVKDLLNDSNDDVLAATAQSYSHLTGKSLIGDIKGDFNTIFGGPQHKFIDRIDQALLRA
ncbi:MAG TPA: hypothetical protein DDX14_02790, partial [Cyanobacteria bacterium UBA9579]|nr:hypothetical protein [Cyanobacteria bacterium UBA9579]